MATLLRLNLNQNQKSLFKKDKFNFQKKQYRKQALNFSSDGPNSAKLHDIKDFFAVSLKIVSDPDWWLAKAFATILCGKPSPGNIKYSR